MSTKNIYSLDLYETNAFCAHINTYFWLHTGVWIKPWWLRGLVTSLIAVLWPTFVEATYFRFWGKLKCDKK